MGGLVQSCCFAALPSRGGVWVRDEARFGIVVSSAPTLPCALSGGVPALVSYLSICLSNPCGRILLQYIFEYE